MKYKNTSLLCKTFWGVTFKAGEVKEVSGYINDPAFVRVPDTTPVSKQETVSKPVANTASATKPAEVKTETKTEAKAEVK